MFLRKKTLLAAFTLLTVTGCITTASKDQQQKIFNLENDLQSSETLTAQAQSAFNKSTTRLKTSEAKVVTLRMALADSQKKLKLSRVAVSPPPKVTHLDDKTIIGQAEWIYVSKVKDSFKGRIDTGAATSSINAVDIEQFERDGKKWVRFNLTHAEGGKAEAIEEKVIRTARIKQSNNPDEKSERPVIQLHVRIGDVDHLTEFTLTNRQHMSYPVLIGRSFIRDVILVDVSTQYSFPRYKISPENKE